MQFVLHELLKVTDEFKDMPKHADLDGDTINAVLVSEVNDDETICDDMHEFIAPLTELGTKMTAFTTELGLQAFSNANEVGAASDAKSYQGKLQTARFYFAKLMPETLSLMATARTGAAVLMDADAVLA